MTRAWLIAYCWLLMSSCTRGLPELRVETSGSSATIGIETLGEYPTGIGGARLIDLASGETIWEVRASNGTPQIWSFHFRLGENSVEPSGVTGDGVFVVLQPRGESTYRLSSRTPYQLTIWDPAKRVTRDAKFRLQPPS